MDCHINGAYNVVGSHPDAHIKGQPFHDKYFTPRESHKHDVDDTKPFMQGDKHQAPHAKPFL